MDRFTITLTETVTPLLKRLAALGQDLTPAMRAVAEELGDQVKQQLVKLPVPWARGTANEIKSNFTALSALVTLAIPDGAKLPPQPLSDTGFASVMAIVEAQVRRAIGGAA